MSSQGSKLPRCGVGPFEPKFRLLLTALFTLNGMIKPGSVVDCGAERGGESCFFADLDSGRRIHAVEPLPQNARSVDMVSKSRPNVALLRGGLGSAERFVERAQHTQSGSMIINLQKAQSANYSKASRGFYVYTLDKLFGQGGRWAGEHLAFGHFDVEGAELDLLKGAEMTIQRDRPVFSIEVELGKHTSRFRYATAMAVLAKLGYRAFVVPENCARPGGINCRNTMCFPSERPPPAWIVEAHNLTETHLGDPPLHSHYGLPGY